MARLQLGTFTQKPNNLNNRVMKFRIDTASLPEEKKYPQELLEAHKKVT